MAGLSGMDSMEGNGFEKKVYESPFYIAEKFSVLGSLNVQEDCSECYVKPRSMLGIVCDGMGGLGNGEFASRKAVNTILNLADEDWEKAVPEFCAKAAAFADAEVTMLRDSDGKPMNTGSTLIMAALVGRYMYWTNVGDSRIYFYRDGILNQITQDHNYEMRLRMQLKNGMISRETYDVEMKRGAALTSYLGIGKITEQFISPEPIKLEQNDIILLESDGLYKLVSEDETTEILARYSRDFDKAGEALLNLAGQHKKNYQDNTSFILIRMK